MRIKRVLFALVLGTALTIPAQARADWLFTPYVGANLSRGGNDALGFDTSNSTWNYGASLAFMGAGIFGFEVDFGYSPNFFGDKDVNTFDSNVTSLMGNLIVGIPIGGQTGGGVRPYVSGGAGLLRSRLDDPEDLFDVDENSFGINAGGGVMAFFSDRVGVRGDLRYFRSIRDSNSDNATDLSLGSFHFWRASAGVTFRF